MSNKNKNSIFKEMKIHLILLFLLMVIFTALIIDDARHPMECTSTSKVEEILSLEGRSATIRLNNGQTISVNQAHLKKGDNYCLSYERKK